MMRLQDRISPPPRTPKGCSCGALRPRHWLQKLYSSSSLRSDLQRLTNLPTQIREIAWDAQLRLCARYRRLAAKGKCKNVVTTAIAREMAAFVWAIAREVEPVRIAA